MTALSTLLDSFRAAGKTERERGTYFEELVTVYLRTEPLYRELYTTVEPHAAWAGRNGLDRRDTGIDLVAETVAGDVHAIQCKLYAADHLDVLPRPQRDHHLPAFGLIICDDPRRTTGPTFEGGGGSAFVGIPDTAYIQGKERL